MNKPDVNLVPQLSSAVRMTVVELNNAKLGERRTRLTPEILERMSKSRK